MTAGLARGHPYFFHQNVRYQPWLSFMRDDWLANSPNPFFISDHILACDTLASSARIVTIDSRIVLS